MSVRIEFLATPAGRGQWVGVDSEGEGTIRLTTDATQLAKVMPLLGLEKGTLLRVIVEAEP